MKNLNFVDISTFDKETDDLNVIIEKSWPGEFGQRGKWRFCLPAAKMAAEQERA